MSKTEVIADELITHHMQPGGTCTCGRHIRIGSSIPLHRAQAVRVALALDELGVPADINHSVTMGLLIDLDAAGVVL